VARLTPLPRVPDRTPEAGTLPACPVTLDGSEQEAPRETWGRVQRTGEYVDVLRWVSSEPSPEKNPAVMVPVTFPAAPLREPDCEVARARAGRRRTTAARPIDSRIWH